MFKKLTATAFVLCCLLGVASIADHHDATWEKTQEAFAAAAEGKCPEALLAQALMEACKAQQPQLSEMLNKYGAVEGGTHAGQQDVNGTTVDAYEVQFANGSMKWMVKLGEDGKLMLLAGGGPFQPKEGGGQ